jgi:DNA-directed RNA polymerase subunit beta'
MIVREKDCVEGTGREIPGMVVKAFMEGKEEIESLKERITERFSCEDIYDAEGNVLVKANHMITPRRAELIWKKGVDSEGRPINRTNEAGKPLGEVKIRTILSCRSHMGVCAK